MGKDNVTAAKPAVGGAAYMAATGSTLPTTAVATLDTAFKALGYISEDGLTNSNTPSSDVVKAWGGDVVLTLEKGKTDTFKFMLLESMDVNVLELVYGEDNVSGTLTAGISISANADDLEEHAFVFDMVLKGDVVKRIVVPSGKVTGVEDVTYNQGAAVGYNITITANPDSDGNTHYEYIKAPTT